MAIIPKPTVRQTIQWGWEHDKVSVILAAANAGAFLGSIPQSLFASMAFAVVTLLMLLVMRGEAHAWRLEAVLRIQDAVLREMRRREKEAEQ